MSRQFDRWDAQQNPERYTVPPSWLGRSDSRSVATTKASKPVPPVDTTAQFQCAVKDAGIKMTNAQTDSVVSALDKRGFKIVPIV